MSIISSVGAVKPLRGQETLYGSGDEANVSYTDADVLDIPLPEHTYQKPLPAVYSQPQSNTSCFGLPYQDHNYGMPPPPSPPRVPTPDPPSPLQVNGVVQMEEEVKTSPLVSVVEEVVEDSITRCICGYLHDDGYMICCDKCSVWQHIDCVGVDRNNIPDNYFCELCQPRELDAMKAKILQKKKREELAARNVLSDSSATDTDPEEAANALASMVKKLPVQKKKGLKQKRNTKTKDKPPLKLKIGKTGVAKKLKKPGKKEKENIKAIKPKRVFKPGIRKLKEIKSRPLMVAEQMNTDPWDSTSSPWVDEYRFIQENIYSDDVEVLSCDTTRLFHSEKMPAFLPYQLQNDLVTVAEVKKNRKGLKAVSHIHSGQGIIEYTGQVMLKHEYDLQHAIYKPTTVFQPFVLFHSKSDFVFCVVATACGNESRFIRRSCTPNAQVQLQYGDKKLHFVILAKKDIGLGVEVTISFDYDYHTSSTCVECACLRNNCIISRFWKKKKKIQQKEFTGRRRRQSSGEGVVKKSQEFSKVSSPQSSPRKMSSPGHHTADMMPSCASPTTLGSPIRLSVSTLLAASALLEAQSETPSDITPSIIEPLQAPTPYLKPMSPPHKINTSQRRVSRTSESDSKDEKPAPTPCPVVPPKEKAAKLKETKIKVKESKEPQPSVSVAPVEVKKERRLSSRRQSQDDVFEENPVKDEIVPSPEEKEDASAAENYRKMTREERKLDAIMKAFEKMEKRQERRKEAVARGEGTTKKLSDPKGKRKDDQEDNDPHSRPVSQDGCVEHDIKVEVEDQNGKPSSTAPNEVKQEASSMSSPPIQSSDVTMKESRPLKEESNSHKPLRKLGKRRRRRSRVQTAPPLVESLVISPQDENSNSSNAPLPSPQVAPAPASAPLPTSMSSVEPEGDEFKYIKSKKHLFNEWSHKHEDETAKQEEMFVECLPSPRINAMDHLQRRNSHSAGCNKLSENSGGFAKKRWLRQAMHEEPAPMAFHHSLSVATDNGSASPVYGSVSPNNGLNMASPGASSPLDFVTPLKKRRLMRESVSTEAGESVHSPNPGVLSESVTIDVLPKSNGLKSLLPSHRHSVDDRLLLHKSFPHQNGFREGSNAQNTGLLKKTPNSTPSSVSVCLKFDSVNSKSEESNATTPGLQSNGLNHRLPGVATAVSSNHLVNGFTSVSDCITSVSLSPSSGQVVTVRAPFERMETGCNEETVSNGAAANRACSLSSSSSSRADMNERKSDNSSRRVVVNSVYNGVNNLMESASDTGCVVTKSIMEADGPATVCVDLNVHEMEEPSAPLPSECKTVVDLDKEIFTMESDNDKGQSTDCPINCPVNSSEDDTPNNVPSNQQGHVSSCDIVRPRNPDSQAPSDCHRHQEEASEEDVTMETSEHVDQPGRELEEIVSLPLSSNASNDLTKNSSEAISSSSQSTTNEVCNEKSLLECDSGDGAKTTPGEACDAMPVAGSSAENASGLCDSGSGVNGSVEEMEVEAEVTGEVQSNCDSADNCVSSAALVVDQSECNVEVQQEVSDSVRSGQDESLMSEDANVDSTSSEHTQDRFSFSRAEEKTSRGAHGSVLSFCDSNSERDYRRTVENDNSISMYDSSSEEVGVSSSSTLQVRSGRAGRRTSPWEEDDCTDPVVREAIPDNALSARSSSPSPSGSGDLSPPSSVVSSYSGNNTGKVSACESSPEACSSSSYRTSHPTNIVPGGGVVSSNSLSSPPPSQCTSSPPPHHHALASQDDSAASNLVSTSSTSDQDVVAHPASSVSPTTSTSEAIPAVKKKVSLLEYRMRLKKSPTTASETKTSSPVSQPCTTVTISSVCERFLSSSPSSTSTTSYSSAASPHRKHKMPTLATLPLFKSTEKKKEERKPVKEKKVEKQLSLNERLRLEFGVDVAADEGKSKSDYVRRSHRGRGSPPPPPPPPPPLPFCPGDGLEHPSTGLGVHSGDSSAVDSSSTKEEAIPPPPPPSRSYPYSGKSVSRPTSSLGPPSIPGVKYAASLVNGGVGSTHCFPQQSNISSSSVSSHSRESNYHPPTAPRTSSSPASHPLLPAYQPIPLPHHQAPGSISPSSTSSSSSSSQKLPQGPSSSWPHKVASPNYAPVSSMSQPSSTSPLPSSSHLPHQAHPSYDYPPHQHHSSSQSQSVSSGNASADDNPPPPPPLPPPPPRTIPRSHHHPSSSSSSSASSSSSSSSHRYPSSSSSSSSSHRRYESSDRNKKAASSSSSHLHDKRSRY